MRPSVASVGLSRASTGRCLSSQPKAAGHVVARSVTFKLFYRRRGRRRHAREASAVLKDPLVHSSLIALLGLGCRSHNMPVAVDVVALVPFKQLLWGLCYGNASTIRSYVDVAREGHFDDGSMHAHRLDLYDDVFWGTALRLCALALPADRRLATSRTADSRNRGDAWFSQLTHHEGSVHG